MTTASLLLTPAQAANNLLIKPVTLAKMRREGSGPRYVRLGTGTKCRVAYRQTDLDAWIESRVQQ